MDERCGSRRSFARENQQVAVFRITIILTKKISCLMKKKHSLIVATICCALAWPSTNCFAQIKFARSLQKGGRAAMCMGASRAALHYDDYRASYNRTILAASWSPAQGRIVPSRINIQTTNSLKTAKLLAPAKNSKPATTPLERPITLSPVRHKRMIASQHASDYYKSQKAAETEEWAAPKELDASSQHPDNRQE